MTKLAIDSLTLSIGNKTLCHNLSFTIGSNQFWGLLGKNGAGKTTLLHSILGIIEPAKGSISFDSVPIQKYSRLELARRVGILFQEKLNSLPATVLETVLLGRYPYAQSLFQDSPDDLRFIEVILKELSLEILKNRKLETLSGGELQRVAIAMLLAQEPNMFLLDEPNNNLDITFQISLLKALKNRVNKSSSSILMATHDINLAARFCDRFILLINESEFLIGNKQEILSTENLSRAYDCDVSVVSEGEKTLYYPI